MGLKEFRLPDLGEGVHEGRVLRLLAKEGERVREDQPLMEVETDKAAVEIPSPFAGVVARWLVHEKQAVRVGDVMVSFAETAGAATGAGAATDHVSVPARATPTAVLAAMSSPHTASAGAPESSRGAPMKFEPRRPASPAVRKLARTLGVDIEVIAGTGPGGRVRMEDVQNAAGTAHTRSVDAAPGQSPSIEAPHSPPRVAGPAAPGRVPPPPLAESREPLSLLRLRVAEVMTESVRTIPHVTDCNDADVTDLDRLRRGWNGTCAEPDRLGMLPFVLSAVARALREHTIFNASLDDAKQEVIHHGHVSIAVGMQTPRGLVAPVVRSADRLSILEIHRELARLTEKCRAGRFETADALGATYTISNAGAIGPTRYSTPIITPPQVAVLAVGRSRQMPWVVDGAVVPRLIMPLSHSMDHRVIDGAVEIAFIASVIGLLENPASLLIS